MPDFQRIPFYDAAVQMELVRFCPECGSVGDVGPGYRDCCPDGNHAVRVPRVIAEQAQRGFQSTIALAMRANEGMEIRARAAFEDLQQVDSRDPSQAQDFALFLKGFLASAQLAPGMCTQWEARTVEMVRRFCREDYPSWTTAAWAEFRAQLNRHPGAASAVATDGTTVR